MPLLSRSPVDIIDREFRLSELLPQAPFAFVYSPAQNSPDTLVNYLTPSTVLTDKSPRVVPIRQTIEYIAWDARFGVLLPCQ
jgi:hypothetical protein